FLVSILRSRPRPTLFPYTTLFRSNVETGKLAWYFQTSPNDTHDWDSTQPSVLVDGVFGGKPRKMAMQASRNGYFYVLDRTTGNQDRKSTRLNSSHVSISYAVFCLK